MTSSEENARPPLAAYEDLARMVDYAVVAPDVSGEQTSRACDRAKAQRVGRLTVRPADLDLVSRWMEGSGITVSAVVSYPHGSDTTAAKLFAVRDALGRGAKAIETVLSPARMISRQFRYLESELLQMSQECHRGGAELTVDFELGWLPADLRVIACRLAKRAEVDWVRPASLYGPEYAPEDVQPLTSKLGDLVKVSGPWPATIEAALAAHAAGVAGFQTTDPEPLLTAWSAELKRREIEAAKVQGGEPGPVAG